MKNVIAMLALATLLAVPLSGCGPLLASLDVALESVGAGEKVASDFSDKAIDKATIPVVTYARQPLTVREDFRERVNASPRMVAAGVKIGIWVEGDPPLTLGPSAAPDAAPVPPAAPD